MTTYILKEHAGAPQFSINYEKELNPQQLQVVLSGDGPALVIAGAGSGKTRVLTYRVARLIESGVSPSSIMLVTFTNKASREMLRRVELLTRMETRRIWGGTFHHIGNLILRRHADLLGYRKNFTIIDRDDARSFMNDCASAVKSERNIKRFPKADALLGAYSLNANCMEDPAATIKKHYPHLVEFLDEIVMLFNVYTTRKLDRNLMDFDDLLTNWRKLLDKQDILDLYSKTLRYVLVDEYQDTNRLQSEIVELITGENGNLMVVGDDSQSIYSFRGASFENIIDFPKRFPKCNVFKLELNYRSTPEILNLSNLSILNNKRQHRKELQAAREGGAKPELVTCGDPMEQAQFIAQRIEELRDDGRPLKEIAVLYRSHFHSMELQMELTRRGIPFEVRSGIRFFEQAHIKDATSYLRIVANPKDEVAWKRIMILYPKIGKAIAAKVWDYLSKTVDPLSAVKDEAAKSMIPKSARSGWESLVRMVVDLSSPNMSGSPSEMLEYVLDNGYEDYLMLNHDNPSNRAEDIRQLANFALGFDSLASFLAELSLLSNVYGEDAVAEKEERDNLILSTIHQAKGLEWRVVFVIWLVEGRFPDVRSMREPNGEEEERRLFYVACTRAKDSLYMTYPIIAQERSAMEIIQRPSQFLKELDPNSYTESTISHERWETPENANDDDRFSYER